MASLTEHELDPWGFYAAEQPWLKSPLAAGFLDATAKKDAARDRKWAKMVSDTNGLKRMASTLRNRSLLKRRVRKGVPAAWRRSCWPMLLEIDYGSARGKPNQGPAQFRAAALAKNITYARLASQSAGFVEPESVEDVIERDLTRTYPRHALFATAQIDGGGSDRENENPGVGSLRRILRSYARLDKEVGYCQGMNYVAALLLVHATADAKTSANDPMRALAERAASNRSLASEDGEGVAGSPEEDAFWLLVSVLRSRRTRLRDCYLPDMSGCHRALKVYGGLLRRLAPKIANHFEGHGLDPSMFATHWFVTIFCAQFPFTLATRVWDAFLAEGMKPVYRVAVALLKAEEKKLLGMDFEAIMMWLRVLPETVDVAKTLACANALPLTTAAVRALEDEFDADAIMNR